jgi:hypothetical protein
VEIGAVTGIVPVTFNRTPGLVAISYGAPLLVDGSEAPLEFARAVYQVLPGTLTAALDSILADRLLTGDFNVEDIIPRQGYLEIGVIVPGG